MNTLNIMEEMLVWHRPIETDSKHDIVGAIYENHIIIGWCTTWQEADAICDQLSHLQWSKKKKIKSSRKISPPDCIHSLWRAKSMINLLYTKCLQKLSLKTRIFIHKCSTSVQFYPENMLRAYVNIYNRHEWHPFRRRPSRRLCVMPYGWTIAVKFFTTSVKFLGAKT